MSILDQLFSEDPAKKPVKVSLKAVDWVVAATALAAHQSMQDGMKSGSTKIDTTLGRPNLEVEGTINVAHSQALSLNYRKMLVQEQLKDVRFKPTGDDVVDAGIKRGSKVVIKIISDDQEPLQSWDSIVRANLLDTDGTPRDLTFDKFSVMSITEPDEQRYQIHETFGADILQTFGRRPRIVTLSGQVVNGKINVNIQGEVRSMDWKNAFQRYYEKHYSAHACTRKSKKVRIFAQDTIYDGYMLNMVAATTAMDQGLSQVTITFLLSSRNFPRENDGKIPGFGSKNGFVLTGRTTPDEYFPQARIESYFQNDFSRVIEVAKYENKREKNILLQELQILDASEEDVFFEDVELDLSDNAVNFYSPASGFRLHKLLKGSNTENSVKSYSSDLTRLNSEIRQFNISVGGDHTSNEITLIDSEDELYVDYQILKNWESSMRLRGQGLVDRVDSMNDISRRIEELTKELSNLEEL